MSVKTAFTLALLSITIIAFAACDKTADPVSPELTLTGTWDVEFTSGSGSDSALFVITEEEGFIRGTVEFGAESFVLYGSTSDDGEVQMGYTVVAMTPADTTYTRYVLTAIVQGDWDMMSGVNVGFDEDTWAQQYFARFDAVKR